MQKAPSDHGLAPLRIDDPTWQTLEKQLGVSLDKDARDEILAAADEFAVAEHFRIVDKARRQLRGSGHNPSSISSLRTHLKRALENWGEIQNDPTAKRLFEDISDELDLGDIAHTMGALQCVDRRLGFYLSPPKHNPFNRYVKKISGICKRPVPITIPAYEDQRTSPFVEFMMTLNTALPDYAQQTHSTPAAWALALYRARK